MNKQTVAEYESLKVKNKNKKITYSEFNEILM